MKTFIIESSKIHGDSIGEPDSSGTRAITSFGVLSGMLGGMGYGNGYIAIPKSHKYHGLDYSDIMDKIDVHGGLTFSSSISNMDKKHWPENVDKDSWVFGFDTCHFNDNEISCDKAYVERELVSLVNQFEKVK